MNEILSKKDIKQAEREQKKSEQKKADLMRKAKKYFWKIFIILIVIGSIIGFWKWTKNMDKNLPGEIIPEMGRNHIKPGDQHEPYNSNPPSSGPHFSNPANAGFYEEMLIDETVVHNLEHGNVWISYKDDADKDLMEKLKKLQKQYSWKTIVTFRPQNDSKIALVAWGRLQKLDNYDEKAIIRFIKAFRNRGPEATPM